MRLRRLARRRNRQPGRGQRMTSLPSGWHPRRLVRDRGRPADDRQHGQRTTSSVTPTLDGVIVEATATDTRRRAEPRRRIGRRRHRRRQPEDDPVPEHRAAQRRPRHRGGRRASPTAAATRRTPTGTARSARTWPATSAMTSWVAPGLARRDLHRDGSVAHGFVAAASGYLPSRADVSVLIREPRGTAVA